MSERTLTLRTPLSQLHGVGEVVAKGLARQKLTTVQDLLLYYPRRWEDYSTVATIASLRAGRVTICGRVEHISLKRTSRRNFTITEAIIGDATGTIKAVWFNQPYLIQSLKKDETYYFAGEFAFKSNHLALQNPSYSPRLGTGSAGRIVPVYPENKAITSKRIAKLIDQVVSLAKELPQVIPSSIVASHKLLSRAEAIAELHQPTSSARLEQARRSIGFEELFSLVVTGLVLRAEIATEVAPRIMFDQEAVDTLLAKLPYKLTDDQRKAAWQIITDMQSGAPTNRLLLGDVGSGKTIVALIAMVVAASAGYQSALLVPTEVLARQHINSITPLARELGLNTSLLVAGLKKADKDAVYADIAARNTDIIIGTHALLQDSLEFAKLGLVVIDEQHRFGVLQRAHLKSKADRAPHLLSMSATPIPRSLALVVYSDLDISIISHKPAGRKQIITKLFSEVQRATAYAQIDEQIAAGRQVYIICPLIEETDESGKKSVTKEVERLSRTVFAHRRIAALHGRMKSEEKAEIMRQFSEGSLDILVSTTVIEVGVDVPNATVMMIEGADRFGLAALHQLRGRVGRSSHQSYCYLFTSTDSVASLSRLEALERTHDGFRLAQIDLETRGAGEIFGTRQSGVLDMCLANVSDPKFIAEVVHAARAFVSEQNVLEFPIVLERVNKLKKVTSLD